MTTQIILSLIEEPLLPVEAEKISPDNFKGKSVEKIYNIPLLYGNREMKIKDFFRAELIEENEGAENDNSVKLFLRGDLSRFKYLGRGMAEGEMEIEGSVGFHAGTMMKGGSLVIKGDAGDWLGAHMAAGNIVVSGSAGHYIGSGWRGEKQGMTGGTILIKGSAGQRAGARMKGGLVAVGGDCGDVPGYGMLNGTILIAGTAGVRVGANMSGGTIILLKATGLLPVFYYNCTYRPPFWRVLHKDLAAKEFPFPESCEEAVFKRYRGDANEGGKGEIFVCQ